MGLFTDQLGAEVMRTLLHLEDRLVAPALAAVPYYPSSSPMKPAAAGIVAACATAPKTSLMAPTVVGSRPVRCRAITSRADMPGMRHHRRVITPAHPLTAAFRPLGAVGPHASWPTREYTAGFKVEINVAIAPGVSEP